MRRLIGILILAAIMLSGCTGKYKLARNHLDRPSPWPLAHGSAAREGSVERSDFNGKLNPLWKQSSGDKLAGPMTIYHDVLIYPGSRKKVRFYETSSGEYRGKLKCKAIPQSGVVVADSIAVFAVSPGKSWVKAVNLLNRHTIWSQPLKDACPGSILVDNSVFISSAEGVLSAWKVDDGALLWSFTAENGFIASASFAGGRIYQPDDHGIVHVLSPTDGSELSQIELEGPVAGPVAVADMVYATDILGNVYAINPVSGDIVWQVTLSGPIWTTAAVQGSRVFVGHSGGELVALDAGNGRELWRTEIGEVIKASPLAVGKYVVIGTGSGLVVTVDGADGAIVDRIQLKGSVDYSPITDGSRVYVATGKGKITCFGE